MDGISRSRGWDKEIPHGVLPMEQLVLSDKWARKRYLTKGSEDNQGRGLLSPWLFSHTKDEISLILHGQTHDG